MNWIRALVGALKARLEARRQRKYDAGWDWAAGQLLRGTDRNEVLAYVETGLYFDAHDSDFDYGALDALDAWERASARDGS